VRPPAAELIEVVSGSLAVLNLRRDDITSKEITEFDDWDLVAHEYPNAQQGQPSAGKKKVKFTQHCEITLALEMLKRTQKRQLVDRKIEIGVSKACCEWCCDYLNLLASTYPRRPILVRASHGKQPDGWMVPPNGPESITRQMIQLIEGRVDVVMGKAQKRRLSDSNELPATMKRADLGAEKQYIAKKRAFRRQTDFLFATS
jgi:hypothetical protein